MCTDHVCSCLVTSAAREWINQSCDECYLKYRFTAYQRITGWSYHWLPSVTGIHFTQSVGHHSSSTGGAKNSEDEAWSLEFFGVPKQVLGMKAKPEQVKQSSSGGQGVTGMGILGKCFTHPVDQICQGHSTLVLSMCLKTLWGLTSPTGHCR